MYFACNDSRTKKYVFFGVASLLISMVVCAVAEANHNSSRSRKAAEIHRELLFIRKTAVNMICSSTDYKTDCTASLQTVPSPDPRSLIRSAFDLAIAAIRSGIDRGLIDVNSRAEADVRTREALNSCRQLMDFAIDDLLRTRDKFGGFLFARISDFVEDLCVWLSGSITYQQTCIDGFEGIDSEAAIIMERVLRKGQHLTSNGLAIASNLDFLLKTFRIPFPFLTSRRDRLSIFGPRYPQDQALDASEDQALDSSQEQSSDSSGNGPVDSSQNRPLESSRNPQNENQQSSSNENQPSDSSEVTGNRQPSTSSEDSSKNSDSSILKPLDPLGLRQSNSNKNQQSNSNENRPSDSSEVTRNRQPSVSSEDASKNSDNSILKPLDPLGLRHLNPLGGSNRHLLEDGGFPSWVTSHSRRLLASRPRGGGRGRNIRADAVVAKDGSGRFKTITQALAMVPQKNKRRFVIHIKQGVYREKVEVTKKMLNVMFVGDGPTKTIITGDLAFLPNRVGTYLTATVAVNGDNFMARDIGFENTAGAARHQAVALRVSADFAVFYNCRMDGYQDTLYVHTHRQFYRDCRISGTIDFVFGDAKAVFQNCEFVIRRPMDNQQCIVTAQGRKDRRETTGIVIHNSRIVGDASYRPVKAKNRAFLGRPWKEFSRTIIMNTEIDDVIDPEGWLKWNDTFALNTLYYSEFRNRGRGSGQARRVRWRGIKRITDRDARQFAPGSFLRGGTWIPQTRVPYNAN